VDNTARHVDKPDIRRGRPAAGGGSAGSDGARGVDTRGGRFHKMLGSEDITNHKM